MRFDVPLNLIVCHICCAMSVKEACVGNAAIPLFGMPADSRMAGAALDFDDTMCQTSSPESILYSACEASR